MTVSSLLTKLFSICLFFRKLFILYQNEIIIYSSSYVEGLNTFSQLRLVPKFTDNRASLICRALNIALRDSLSNASNGDKHGNVQQSNSKINGNNIGTNTNGNISTWNGHHHHHHRMDHYGEPIKRQTDRFGFRLPFQLETSVLLDVNCKCHPILTVSPLVHFPLVLIFFFI